MNFFAAQAQARRRSIGLVLGFCLALALTVCWVYLLAHWAILILAWFGLATFSGAAHWMALATGAFIALGARYGWQDTNGAAVAEKLGARALATSGLDASERQLLNVVQEMAIATGCPVPAVYILEHPSINALAAGSTPQQALIVVTRGALKALNRDELQAVVAHEFSHILNGDMRLNMRMAGVLFGLMAVGAVGEDMWERRDLRTKVLGCVFIGVGAAGRVMAQVIKDAVCRQREFLADASAVQFTRNPMALIGVLEKIQVQGPGAASDALAVQTLPMRMMAHFFFVSPVRSVLEDWLATHPSLDARIRVIDPRAHLRLAGADHGLALAATLQTQVPEGLRSRLELGGSAVGVVYGLLMHDKLETRQAQCQRLGAQTSALVVDAALEAHLEVRALAPPLRLVVLSLALPALRALPPVEQDAVLYQAQSLVMADGKVIAFALVATVLLQHTLRPSPGPTRLRSGASVLHMRMVLSFLAYCGAKGQSAAAQAAYAQALPFLPALQKHALSPPQACVPQAVQASLLALGALAPQDKEPFVAALRACALQDGRLRVVEWEIVRVLCQCLGVACPLTAPGFAHDIFATL